MGFLIDTNILSELQKGERANIGVKNVTVPANTPGYLPDLGEFRGKQECYTRQNIAMIERPACSTSDRFAETSRLNAASKNSGQTTIFHMMREGRRKSVLYSTHFQ